MQFENSSLCFNKFHNHIHICIIRIWSRALQLSTSSISDKLFCFQLFYLCMDSSAKSMCRIVFHISTCTSYNCIMTLNQICTTENRNKNLISMWIDNNVVWIDTSTLSCTCMYCTNGNWICFGLELMSVFCLSYLEVSLSAELWRLFKCIYI